MILDSKIILVNNPFKAFKPSTYVFGLIRLFTKTEYNHSVIYIKTESEELIFESLGKGIVCNSKQDWEERDKNRITKVLDIQSKVGHTQIYKRCKNLLGQKYDYNVYFNYFLGKRFNNIFNLNNSKWYCHEFCYNVFKENYNNSDNIVTAKTLENYEN